MLLALRVVGNILFLVGGLFFCKYLVFPMGGFSDKMGNGKYFERSLGMPLQWLRLYKGVCDGFCGERK